MAQAAEAADVGPPATDTPLSIDRPPTEAHQHSTTTPNGDQASSEAHDVTASTAISDGNQVGFSAVNTHEPINAESVLQPKQEPGEKKRYYCNYPGCGKDYSRAEHLYRHQLNHNPKELHRCKVPGCDKTFVRSDLCLRHQERHMTRTRQELDATPAPSQTHNQYGNDDEISALVARSSVSRPPQTTHQDAQSSQLSDASSDDIDRLLLTERSPEVHHTAPVAAGRGFGASNSFQRASNVPHGYIPLPSPHKRPAGQYGLEPAPTRRRLSDTYGGQLPYAKGDPMLNDSPMSVRDEFTNWLFDDAGVMSLTAPGGAALASMDGFGSQVYANYFEDSGLDDLFAMPAPEPVENMEAPSAKLQSNKGFLTPGRRQALLNLMAQRFSDDDTVQLKKLRQDLFAGDQDSQSHTMSLSSLQTYIECYWTRFHGQMPILHRATFDINEVHPYLLLAIMVIGASRVSDTMVQCGSESSANFAAFVAWHLRWQVFRDADSRPPAKLWVFQTLILLEVYEKLNSSRALHERAHIHSPTTIILMRRGTALIHDPQAEQSEQPTSPEQWWTRWIQAEATRRAAFAAFYLDSLNAIIFGHASMLSVVELRLPLPCDEALWSATSAAEVGRVEASLHANGVQQLLFTDALRQILTGRRIRTNPFGRMILMAGLLSVIWHMQQRDLQMTVLGVSQGMGVQPNSWREALRKSLDFWKKDFDDSVAHMQRVALPWQAVTFEAGELDNAACATTLWHLGHMAMNVDFRDCQMFAAAKFNLGRPVTDNDRERAKNNISGWIRTTQGREAVFHSLQVLKAALLKPSSSGIHHTYNARDDYIFLRPWTLYFSGLIVWCWGYMVDGLLRPFPAHLLRSTVRSSISTPVSQDSREEDWTANEQIQNANLQDARLYLQTIGAASSPQELESIKAGRNNVVGLLRTLGFAFRDARWELLREAAERMRSAVKMLER